MKPLIQIILKIWIFLEKHLINDQITYVEEIYSRFLSHADNNY